MALKVCMCSVFRRSCAFQFRETREMDKRLYSQPWNIYENKQQIYGSRYKKDEDPLLLGQKPNHRLLDIPVQLLQDVHGLGRTGDVVLANTGDIRRFLFPNGLCRYLTWHEHNEFLQYRDSLAHWFGRNATAVDLQAYIDNPDLCKSLHALLGEARAAELQDFLERMGHEDEYVEESLKLLVTNAKEKSEASPWAWQEPNDVSATKPPAYAGASPVVDHSPVASWASAIRTSAPVKELTPQMIQRKLESMSKKATAKEARDKKLQEDMMREQIAKRGHPPFSL